MNEYRIVIEDTAIKLGLPVDEVEAGIEVLLNLELISHEELKYLEKCIKEDYYE